MSSSGKASLGNTREVDGGLLRRDISFQESQKIYNQWAKEGTYDKMLGGNPTEYNGLVMFTEGMKGLFSDVTKVKVLDVGAGTGLSGEKLRVIGYTWVDGLEPAASMAEILFLYIFASRVVNPCFTCKPASLLHIRDTYDAICTTGCFGPGHIPCSAVPEMIRIVRWLYLELHEGRVPPQRARVQEQAGAPLRCSGEAGPHPEGRMDQVPEPLRRGGWDQNDFQSVVNEEPHGRTRLV
ncbi:hypothetical protein RRG08_051753 [Elysia crispata]|uniref:Uncharacterized protein n=1 Tax=Elysia crispata TaxID=231223 RepID=A0AAE1B7V9_9GAST|nr:hypothetical protein RRG08_051753 [Elysia crispata]